MNVAERDINARARRRPPPTGTTSAASSARKAFDARTTALTVLTVTAGVGFLWWAQAVFIPILLALLITHALEPTVGFLEKQRCPRPLATFVVLATVIGALGYGVYALGDPVSTFIDQMPVQARKLRIALQSNMRGGDAFGRVQQAANELERAASSATAPPPAPAGVQRVRVEEPPFRLRDLLWRGSRGLLEFLAAIVVVFFLTFYLLLAGDLFRRKLASIAGPSIGRRRLVLRILLDVDAQIRRYLIARLAISLIVALASWAALAAVGLNQAAMWGVIAGIFNVVPYVGPISAIAGITLAAFAQFGIATRTGVAAGLALLIAFLEGNVLTPRLTARAGGLNSLAIFASVLFWGWLWGIWGMLLAVPMMTALKAICSRIDDLHPVAALLSD